MRITPLSCRFLRCWRDAARAPICISHVTMAAIVTEYKAKYERIRDARSAHHRWHLQFGPATLVVRRRADEQICVTPRASLGSTRPITTRRLPSHQVTQRGRDVRPDVLLPQPVKDWIRRMAGLTTEMKKIKNAWISGRSVDPCPEIFDLRVSPAT